MMMFTNESTENLLNNLDDELTEVIELENPREFIKMVETRVDIETDKRPPIPAKRNHPEPIEVNPIPAARKQQPLDKREKNDENEIIQLSSMSSSSTSENHRNVSQNTIVVAKGRKVKPVINEAFEMTEELPEGKFFVSKHGKWAEDEKVPSISQQPVVVETEIKEKTSAPLTKSVKKAAHIEVISEKPTKKTVKQVPSSTSSQSYDSSSETSSSSEESVKPKKKSKKKTKDKSKKKSKKKDASDDQVSSTESSVKEDIPKVDLSQAIGVFLNSTGTLKFNPTLTSLRVNVSFYNEDGGKQIGESKLSKHGTFNDDFHNLICTWNEMVMFDQDLKRLREIYNNVLVFFEVTNSNGMPICWAFLKLFSPSFANIDDKFKLQFFEYQKINRKILFPNLRRNRNQSELTIFEQWRMERKKFASTLNVTIKVFKQMPEAESLEKTAADKNKVSIESINRKWQKLPGQACKIPNKLFRKIPLNEKGSMNVKFSLDGNLVAFTEVTREGSILHIQKFPELQEVFTMLEHSDLIHDIDWLRQKQSLDNRQWMLTASSDFTAIVWRLEESSYTYSILPHPSFVYASKFLQNEDTTKIQVVTAGRDCIVRIWQNRKKLEGFELMQELKHPNITKTSYITTIASRNADTFYTAGSNGDVIEWTLQATKDYHLNRHFKLDETAGNIITNMELHPRGNKLFIRIQDFTNSGLTGTIFVIGVPTGLVTQRHHQSAVEHESAGKLRVTSCGTNLFASNGSVIRFYSLANGNLTSTNKNFLSTVRIPSSEKISSIDYHPKDFYFACSVYGRNGCVIICSFESETEEKDLFDKLKVESSQLTLGSHLVKAPGKHHFSDIIRKLDEVFLAPIESDASRRAEIVSRHDENTLSVGSKRSGTYTVSQGPATYTVQRSQNNTYEVQRKDESDDDDTTISESFN